MDVVGMWFKFFFGENRFSGKVKEKFVCMIFGI